MTEGRPSSTALYIAKKLVFAADEPGVGELVPPMTAQMSRRYVEYASPAGARQLAAYRRPWVRVLVCLLERVTLPGMTLHYVVRKRHLERVARQSLQEGYTQLVVLGAGFDTLTLRLSADTTFNGVTMVEIDHPATQRVKLEVLQRYELLSTRVAFLPCDFGRDDLSRVLQGCNAHRAGARTLVIAEGLLMYLEPAQVEFLLGSIRETLGEGVRLAFTFMEPQPGGRIAFGRQSRVVDLWLRWRREPFRWGIGRSDLTGFLARLGYSPQQVVDAAAFKRMYLEPRGLAGQMLADGDHLCVADGS